MGVEEKKKEEKETLEIGGRGSVGPRTNLEGHVGSGKGEESARSRRIGSLRSKEEDVIRLVAVTREKFSGREF